MYSMCPTCSCHSVAQKHGSWRPSDEGMINIQNPSPVEIHLAPDLLKYAVSRGTYLGVNFGNDRHDYYAW